MLPAERSQYRPDIDGLRAVAVLSVFGFHAAPMRVPGGFVGVDVFFVISGFLITRILLRSLDQGSFSYRHFYARRIQRIFPPLFVAMVLTLLLGWVILLPREFVELSRHLIAGALFSSNILLWMETGYFDRAAEQKPLLHLWSLGVEEQFYILWPVLLVALYRFRRHRTLLLALLSSALFGASVWIVGHDASAAYYLPLSRFWELLVGATLGARSLSRRPVETSPQVPATAARVPLPVLVRSATSLGGLALILWSMFSLDRASPFPGWNALAPTIGAAAVIWAGANAWPNRSMLGSKIAVGVGVISYSLYLWHWPLLAYINVLAIDDAGRLRLLKVAAIAVAVLGAALTYWFVERPLQRRPTTALPWHFVAALGAVCVVAFAGLRTDGFAAARGPWNGGDAASNGIASIAEVTFTPLCLQRFGGAFRPTFMSQRDFCIVDDTSRATHDVLVLGDSHAQRLYLGLRAIGPASMLGRGTCLPLIGVEAHLRGESSSLLCDPAYRGLIEATRARPARTIVLHGFFPRVADGRIRLDGGRDLASGMREILKALSPVTNRIVVVLDVPELPFAAATCLRRPIRPARVDCSTSRHAVDAQQQRYAPQMRQVAAEFPNVTVFDPTDVLCNDSRCFAMLDGELLYSDSHHLNQFGAQLVARALRPVLK